MKQLGTLDSAFINLELPNTPQHIGGMGIYDQSTAPDGKVRFKELISHYERRLKKMPIFRTRLVKAPLGLDKPYWTIDDKFDVEFHLRHIALPKPGDWRQLCIQLARLHSRPLDMSRPLWECYIIEGLDNIPDISESAFAIYTKMHHSLVDGAGAEGFMSALHDLEPCPAGDPAEDFPLAEEDHDGEYHPSNTSTAGIGRNIARNNMTRSFNMMKGMVGLGRSAWDVISKVRNEEMPPMEMSTEKCRFENPVSPHRVVDATLFDLDAIKQVRRATDTKINDVALAIVGGGLRKYLLAHNDLPEQSLITGVPVNVREEKKVHTGGVSEDEDNNQVGAISVSLHTDIDDPLERLQAIHISSNNAKAYVDTPVIDMLKVVGVFNPWVAQPMARMYANRELTNRLPISQACTITNVMGPPFPLYTAGAKLSQYYCLGLLTPGMGLFHSVFSMDGVISLTVLADRNQMGDPDFYIKCLEESFEELCSAVEKEYSVKIDLTPVGKDGTPATGEKPAKKAAAKKRPKKKTASKAKPRKVAPVTEKPELVKSGS